MKYDGYVLVCEAMFKGDKYIRNIIRNLYRKLKAEKKIISSLKQSGGSANKIRYRTQKADFIKRKLDALKDAYGESFYLKSLQMK